MVEKIMDAYKPINCELHDGFELDCIRHSIKQVIWRDADGHIHNQTLRYLDMEIKAGEEFLVAENREKQQLRIRLDQIESC